MLDEIEKFLRQAAAKRQAQPQQPARPQPPKAAEIVEPEIVVYDDVEAGANVADHVAQHMETGAVTERTSHMADRFAQSEDKMTARMQQKFDHKIGQLQDTSEGSASDKQKKAEAAKVPLGTSPGELLKMLRRPASVQQAIIMSEILNRPDHNW